MADERSPLAGGLSRQGYHPQVGAPPQGQYQAVGATPYPPPGPYPQAGGAYPPAGATPYPQGQHGPGYPPAGAAPPAGAVASYQGEMPHEDVKDDPSLQAPAPSAPALDQMGVVAGYERVGFSATSLAPPSYEESMQGPPPERTGITSAPTITEEDARAALHQFVAENCCYGSKAAKEMVFRELKSSSAFHYTLETFAESRSTCWAYEPYRGQAIDGPERGPAPGPWDVQATVPALFSTHHVDVEVPHTASVKPCHNCFARGYTRCYRCHGRGRLFCHQCHGKGHETVYENGEHIHRRCIWCDGDGRRRCYTCNGFGQVECTVCRTQGNLKCYIKLTIQWTNHTKDHVVERTALPDQLIRDVSGQLAFEEQQPRVWPINHFPDQEINMASKSLVQEHSQAFPTERIIMQRQRVRIVPVTQVMYTYKTQQNAFFVYGFEHKVYAPDYPDQCCWGCTLL